MLDSANIDDALFARKAEQIRRPCARQCAILELIEPECVRPTGQVPDRSARIDGRRILSLSRSRPQKREKA